MLAQIGVDDPADVKYWGTTSGNPLPERIRQQLRWTTNQILDGSGGRLSRAHELERVLRRIELARILHAEDRPYRNKLPLYRAQFDWTKEPTPPVLVSARRIGTRDHLDQVFAALLE